MDSNNKIHYRQLNNSHKAFRLGLVSIGLILIMLLSLAILNSQFPALTDIAIGILLILIGIVSILGLVKSIRGLKDPNTFKKIIGLIINFAIAILFISVILANGYDVYNAFYG